MFTIYTSRFLLLLLTLVAIGCNTSSPKNENNPDSGKYTSEKVHLPPTPQIVIGTYLGNQRRNYYGNEAPRRLDVIWRTPIGKGKTVVGRDTLEWGGAG
ncbi:hypothetical protein BKI52_32605 [marine bacterium AO1-C]|nr:hypothetical protein BKI52_32605 [marine bacterium AO1-C]